MTVAAVANAHEARQGLDATPAQWADLNRYVALLEAGNARMNLVGPSAMTEIWDRHIFDSAQLLALAPGALRWVDLGAGAGLPGLVLAILLKGQAGASVVLVESVHKRCRFLQEVIDALALPASVHVGRAEAAPRFGAQVVTARACAPLARLLDYAWPQLRPGDGAAPIALFLKGRRALEEVAAARARWRFAATATPSRSDPGGVVLRLEDVSRGR